MVNSPFLLLAGRFQTILILIPRSFFKELNKHSCTSLALKIDQNDEQRQKEDGS